MLCKYNQTFICNSERGYYTDIESEVFLLWKSKLRKHEEKNALKANYAYRTDKRLEKQQQMKESTMKAHVNESSNRAPRALQNQSGMKY